MNKYTVSKRQVIKAMRTEPLYGNCWIGLKGETPWSWDKNNNLVAKELADCTVCAVGAVLRGSRHNFLVGEIHDFGAALFRNDQVTCSFNYCETIKQVYDSMGEAATPLAKLSILFEGLWEYYKLGFCPANARGSKMKALRKRLVDFVKAEFPDKITINL